MVSAVAMGQRPHYDFGEIEFRHAHEILPTPLPHSFWLANAPELIDVFNTNTRAHTITLILLIYTYHPIYIYT